MLKLNDHSCCALFTAVLLCHVAPLCSQERSTKPVVAVNELVYVQAGDLPIILSAPHGGTGDVPGVSERSGAGLPTGPSGFFSGRDGGTEELAQEVADAIKMRFGKSPYVVISKVHRKFMDPNRPSHIALEDAKMKPYYDHYHDSLSKYCREVTDRFKAGVLIDLHGQGTSRETVFRGTKNGLTVAHLRQTFGEAAHNGPKSLFGLLSARGWTVHPSPHDEKEQSGFTGGFIVQSYGSMKSQPIDAMQLEFGAEYRVAGKRAKTAAVLADALVEYASLYLKLPIPIEQKTSESAKPRLKVAAFIDAGPKLFSCSRP
jgi:N-formylglutamate amidohydrolase